VEEVDFVSGVGKPLGQPKFVITNLCVFDLESDSMRVRSLHPGVTVDDVVANTGFELQIDSDVPPTRDPTDEELRLIREELDANETRKTEI
jgi:acyl CoA:acetate/3-ketoacid CoA transferase beta subunit